MLQLTGGDLTHKGRVSSRTIAKLTNKQHKNVIQSIKNMEPAWEKINGLKFELVTYTDKKGQQRPEYLLTPRECLYVSTKYNDEARARLVIYIDEMRSAWHPGIQELKHKQAQIRRELRSMSSRKYYLHKRLDKINNALRMVGATNHRTDHLVSFQKRNTLTLFEQF